MILRDRCSTLCDLASLFRGAVLLTEGVEKRKTNWHEAVSSALNFPFLKEVSNSFVFDVVNFETCLYRYVSICLSASLKTKLFCETSSIFQADNIKNEAILRDFLSF